MGDLSEFSLKVRLFLRAYPWRRIDPVPWAKLEKPLSQCRLALVSTAGLTLPDQPPFDDGVLGGDYTFREIPSDAEMSRLVDSHRSESYDHAGLQQDPNLALPIDRARELVEEGVLGSLNQRHLSFMGSITAPGRLIKRSAPQAAQRLLEDDVDLALLVPV